MKHLSNAHSICQSPRCIKCRHKEHFAKDLLEHMHREDHMDEPFVHCPQCKAAFEMEKIQGCNSTDILGTCP